VRSLLATLGVPQSAGRVATCCDNAVAESFFATQKRELVHNKRFGGLADAKRAIARWIHRYHTVRLHSTIGYVPPVGYELRYAREGMAAANFRLSSKWGKGQHSGSRSSVVQNTQCLLLELLILLPLTHWPSVH
jgi:hypothetical protein